jgi:hypothetical protein
MPTTRIIRPRNWRNFQHYKQRRPPWIRLHRTLLDDFEFASLTCEARALAPLLWLLASEESDGMIVADTSRLAFRFRWAESVLDAALDDLIDRGFFELLAGDEASASVLLASRKQNVTSETETEAEAEAETETETEQTREVFAHWVKVHSKPRAKLDDKRSKLIRSALRIGYSVADLKAAIDGCKNSPFHQGDNDRATTFDDLGLILRDASKIDQFIGYTTHKPPRLGRAGSRTAAAAKQWLDEPEGAA